MKALTKAQKFQQAEMMRYAAAVAKQPREPLSEKVIVAPSVEVSAFDGAGFEKLVGEMLAKITPMTAVESRAWDFANSIGPRLADFGFLERYRVDGLLDGLDRRCALQREVLGKLQGRCTGVGAIIAMVGPRGTGKTSIAAQMLLERIWREWEIARSPELSKAGVPRMTALYRKAQAVMAQLKGLYADFGSTAQERLESERLRLAECDVLILDELQELMPQGEKPAPKFGDVIITDLLDLRYSARRDTVLISNQTKADFDTNLNPSVMSRLKEHGGTFRCEWESFREVKPV